MKIKITRTIIDKLEYDEAKGNNIYFAESLTGFGVKVNPTGKKTFIVQGRIKDGTNKTIRINIGTYSSGKKTILMTPEEAEKKARLYLLEMENGNDPRIKKQPELTLNECIEAYIENTNFKNKEETIKQINTYRNKIPNWLNLPITQITRQMLLARFNEISKTTKSGANRFAEYMTIIFNFVRKTFMDNNGISVINVNPCEVFKGKKHKIQTRKPIIEPEHLKEFFEALKIQPAIDTYQAIQTKQFCLIALFTGCRSSEITTLKRRHVDIEKQIITLEETKNGLTIEIPMANYIKPLFKDLIKGKANEDYLFPAQNKEGHLKNYKRTLKRIKAAYGHEWTPHICRHSFIHYASIFCPNIPVYTVADLVNHTSGKTKDITHYYTARDMKKMKEAIDRIEHFILSNAGIIPAEETVIPFRKQSATG